jgi:hypothetical protein
MDVDRKFLEPQIHREEKYVLLIVLLDLIGGIPLVI